MFLESRQHRSSFWGCAEILQTPKNPIRRPTPLHSFPKCKSAARIRCRLEVLPQVPFFSLLHKTWANRSVVTGLVFLSCCNCTCFKTLVPKKWILQSRSQNPRILLTTLDWREQYLAHKRSLLLQPNTQNTNPPREAKCFNCREQQVLWSSHRYTDCIWLPPKFTRRILFWSLKCVTQ